jgi:hypothetical protein
VRAMKDQVRFLPAFVYQRVRAGEDIGCGRIALERRRDIFMDGSDPREAIADNPYCSVLTRYFHPHPVCDALPTRASLYWQH